LRILGSWLDVWDERHEKQYGIWRAILRHGRTVYACDAVDLVCLTITHDRLEPESEMLEGISKGWPKVLSSLKTLLEVGRPLPKLW